MRPNQAGVGCMSVVAHSPFTGNKRLFDDDASNDSYDWASSCKRGRFVGSPAAAGRGSPKRQAPSSVTPATFTALCGLFPEMDEQVRVWGAAGAAVQHWLGQSSYRMH